ncbi:hypothetical protein LTR36_003135 [Oleoguttula mirabilis]|uniref:Uncharacterized protein n=1 Tax=Oleoguttula mirabilis TaxID=1507867 RepID=A0AAV9JX17_9PEZI|nr:hypothetical protein LTR36_003135 [Oleoguttula mirabilis]
MSLVRAFTTRRNKPEMQISTPMYIGRAASQRGGKPVLRAQISSPVALVSTSNVLLNNAHSIAGTSPIELRSVSSGSSISSGSADDSDASTANGSIHSRDTVTDASSIDESPIQAEPNHLSCYFKPAVNTQSVSPELSPSLSAHQSLDTPRIPQRVPSHSKKAHETLHRKNSVRRLLSPPPTAREAIRDVARSSTELFSPTKSAFVEAPKESPFGRELAQLDAVAEEFGHVVRDAEADADMVLMRSRGLAHFAASDYLSEIQSLIYDTFTDTPSSEFGGWI